MNTSEKPVAPMGVPFVIEGRRFVRERVTPDVNVRPQVGLQTAAIGEARMRVLDAGYCIVDTVSVVNQFDGTYIVEFEIAPAPSEEMSKGSWEADDERAISEARDWGVK